MMRLSIRTQLSIRYSLTFALAGVLLCFASYLMARGSLRNTVEHELDEHIDDVRDYFLTRGLSADAATAGAQVSTEFESKDDGKWLQIEDDQGRWIYRARRMLTVPQELPPAATLPARGKLVEFVAQEKRVIALIRAVNIRGRTMVVESGATLTKTEQTLALFRNGLLLISPAIFLMAGLAGHLLSRRALHPVAVIAREAQRIHDGNLQARLPKLDTRDELAHLSATLNEMLERIESGVQSVRDFTAYASHELRTPLTLIRTEADLALECERSGGEYREAIGAIGAEAQRMSFLVDSLLFMARADAGSELVQPVAVDARRICMQAADKWRPLLQKAGLSLIVDLPQGSVPVMADPPHLQRLLAIVLENAGKYTTPGGLVRLTLVIEEEGARFKVADTGIGIPCGEEERIFERFCRGSNALIHAHGSGLGLALAAWIAQRHGTRIEVESAVGAGSSFAWKLPLVANLGAECGGGDASPMRRHRELTSARA